MIFSTQSANVRTPNVLPDIAQHSHQAQIVDKTSTNCLIFLNSCWCAHGGMAIMWRMTDYSTDTTSAPPPDYTGITLAAAVMAVTGWIGLWLVITSMLPTAFPRWLFFVFMYLAVTGTVLPFVRFLNVRFSSDDTDPTGSTILRQSVWVGLFVVACAWLQIPRVLNPVIALFLAASLIVVEFFLHMHAQD